MNRLQQRAEQLARAQVRRQIGLVAESWRERVQGVAVSVESTGVVLSGKAMLRRWLTEPGMRFLRSTPR